MSTSEEFEKAIELINSCKGSVSCGCVVDEQQSYSLYVLCSNYLKAYVERFGEY